MDYRIYFSLEYLELMISYLNVELKKLPLYKLGTHIRRGESVACIRDYDPQTKRVLHEFSIVSKEGNSRYQTYLYRQSLEKKLQDYMHIWEQKSNRPLNKIGENQLKQLMNFGGTNLTNEFYENLQAESGRILYDRKRPLIHNDIAMASKIEVIVASILDQLDLEYKYETQIYINFEEKLADFFINIRLLNRCFPIEVLGLLDDENYLAKFQRDIRNYVKSGYLFGKNLLLIGETSDIKADTERIAQEICDFINRLTSYTLKTFENGFSNDSDVISM